MRASSRPRVDETMVASAIVDPERPELQVVYCARTDGLYARLAVNMPSPLRPGPTGPHVYAHAYVQTSAVSLDELKRGGRVPSAWNSTDWFPDVDLPEFITSHAPAAELLSARAA